jgi:molybdopterin adenylyltransferase
MHPCRTGILTVSDRSFLALQEDLPGRIIRERVLAWGWTVAAEAVVPDDPEIVSGRLASWADEDGLDLVLTSGGTGLSPRDRTPEATAAIAERPVPGISEWLRSAAGAAHPHAYLSRGLTVLRGTTLIINLPGSPKAVRESLDQLGIILPHALQEISRPQDWGPSRPHPCGGDPGE